MLFQEVRIPNKRRFLRETIMEVMENLKPLFENWDDLSQLIIYNYVEQLVEESEFDANRRFFKYPITNHKITAKDFAAISESYINDHMEDFLK